MTNQISAYIHWPFCLSKCQYCGFMSVPFDSDLADSVFLKILSDIDEYKNYLQDRNLVSIFFGGGTPSLLSPDKIEKIINKIIRNTKTSFLPEITIETNPDTVDYQKLTDFKKLGINRLSLGCQSFFDDDLRFLGRRCDGKKTLQAAENTAKIFSNYSFDFIYGFKLQTQEKLRNNIEKAISFGTPHLSLYRLTLEPKTPLFKKFKLHKYSDISDLEEERLYNLIYEILIENGLYRYEVSNYAKSSDFESIHNLAYWNYQDYIGVGPSAHSRIFLDKNKYAGENDKDIKKWLVSKQKFTKLTEDESNKEAIIMGLRTKYGVSKKYFSNLDLKYFLKNNLLKDENNNYIIPQDKLIISDYIIREVISLL